MLIRTQDKTELINVNNIEKIMIIGGLRIAVQTISNERWTTIGEYPEGKAIEIFNAIAKQYDILQYFTRHPNLTEKTSSVFVMPEAENCEIQDHVISIEMGCDKWEPDKNV